MSWLTKIFGLPDININKLLKGDKAEQEKAKAVVIPLAETLALERADSIVAALPRSTFLTLRAAMERRAVKEEEKPV